MDEIKNFVEKLANFPVGKNVINIYDYSDENNKIRRWNLKLYFQKMKTLEPKSILIGEAPGYKGCRLTGIPFTSEYILVNNKFLQNNGYETVNEQPNLNKEQTATIMWEVLDKYKNYPLLWNAFPFHPHKEKNQNSNRKPLPVELKQTLNFLENIFRLFPKINKAKIGAVGLVAEDLLNNKMGLKSKHITHPSFGRKTKFIEDIQTFFEFN